MSQLAKPCMEKHPWYRHSWPWLLMIPPGAAVIGGVLLLYLATSDPYALAVTDYTRIEAINSRQAAMKAGAQALGLSATANLKHRGDATVVDVSLAGVDDEILLLDFRHPTRDEYDRRVTLRQEGEQRFRGRILLPVESRYYLLLTNTAADWQLRGTTEGVSQGRVTLEPR